MASISDIESINPKSATRLRKAGIRTTEGLLRRAASPQGRQGLAEQTGLTEDQLLKWVNRSDLMRVKGIGAEYADLLEACGVDCVRELRKKNATTLTPLLVEMNEKKRLVRRLPTEGMMAGWISHAKQLEIVVRM